MTACLCAGLPHSELRHHPLCPSAPKSDEILAQRGNVVAFVDVENDFVFVVAAGWELCDDRASALARFKELTQCLS